MTLKSQIDRFSQNEENFNALITGSAGTTVDLGDAGIVKSVATVIGEIAPGIDRGSWATTTAYIINDIVLESGAYYRCRENHTSGTFATDLAAGKWRLNQGGDSTILTHRGRTLDDAITARFDDVTQMIADVNLAVGDVVETFANQNGAAINQKWDIVAAATGVDNGGNYIDLTGSGLQAKQVFGGIITPEHFGAAGNSTADDTSALNGLDSYLATLSKPVSLVFDGIYKLNPLNTNVPLGSSNARAVGVYSDNSTVSGGGTFLIDSVPDYTAGHSAGDELYYSAVQLLCNNTTVANIHFNGNGKHTASAYNPAVVNIRFQLAACFGTSLAYRKNNHVYGCTGTDFGGQALSFQYVADSTYYKCVFDKNSGIAIGPATASHILYCTNSDTYDAPVVMGSVVKGSVVGCTLSDSTNGSGIDIIGCEDFDATLNTVSNMQGAGIWVHYHSQQSNTSKDIRIHNNTLIKNARYTGTPVVGEIVLGKTDASAVQEVDRVSVYNNTIELDGSLAANADRAILVGLNVDDVSIYDNKYKGALSSSANIIKVFDAVNGLNISNNEWQGTGIALIDVVAQPTNFKFNNNIKLDHSLTATYFHDIGSESDESIISRTRRNLTTTPVEAVKVAFPATESYAVIDVHLLCAGFAGETVRRIVVSGTSGTTATVLENATVSTFGSAPPAITVDTATTGIARVRCAAASGTRSSVIYAKVRATESCSINFNIT